MANIDQILQRNKDLAVTASTRYDGSSTLPGEVRAVREAVPPPGPSRGQVLRSLA
jgi:hypothetical protein